MPQFEYKFHRSNAEASQHAGVKCSVYSVEGRMHSHSINAIKEFCLKLMTIAGVYSLQIRNTEPGCEWKHFEIDTRNPEAASEAVSKAKKKAKRTKKH